MATGQLGLEATIVGPAGPAGSNTIIVAEGGTPLDTDISTVDFDATDFNLTESPENTVNVALNYGTAADTPAAGNHAHAGTYQPLDTDLTAIAALADPNADRILFWDDSLGAYTYLTPGTNLSITGTTINATGGGTSLLVTEGGVTVDATVATLEFDASDFNVTESPEDQANISLAYGTSAGTPAEGNHSHANDHVAATVLDTASIDMTLSGQQISAAAIFGTTATTVAQGNHTHAYAPTASPTFTGTVTLPTGLTGVIRADTGVVSVDADVTDIVSAATTTAAGKVELATDAETNTGTDTTRAITPSNLEAWTGSAFVTTVGTLASPVLTTPTIASFTNATHTHTNAAGGGTLDAAAIASGLLANARIATGTPTGSKYLRDDQVWTAVTPGGSATQVQFNDGGVLGGDAGFTYDPITDAVNIAGALGIQGSITQTNLAPGFLSIETGADPNEGAWQEVSDSGTRWFRTVNDALNAVTTWLSANRSGNRVDVVTVNPDALDTDFVVKGDTDANLLVTDASTDRVGIGIATPQYKLDVRGTLGIVSAGADQNLQVLSGAAGSLTDIVIGRTSADARLAVSGGAGEWSNGVTGAGHIILRTEGTPLHISSNSGNPRNITLAAAGASTTFNPDLANQDTVISGDTDANLLYADASADRVGVGTATPAAKLDVAGTGVFSGDVTVPNETYGPSWDGSNTVPTKNAVYDKIQALSLAGGAPGGADYEVQFNNVGLFGGDAGFTYNPSTDAVNIAGALGIQGSITQTNLAPGYISIETGADPNEGAWQEVSDSGTRWFRTVNDALNTVTTWLSANRNGNRVDVVTVNPDGLDTDFNARGDTDTNLLFVDASTDRVGIGTATPSAKLHVASTGSTNLYVDGAVAGQSNLILAANGTPQWYFGRQATTHNFFLYNNTDGVDFIYMTPIAGGTGLITINDDASNIDTIIRGDTDTNLLYVDASTDRVGIGTATPAHKLDVSGNIHAGDGTTVFDEATTVAGAYLGYGTGTTPRLLLATGIAASTWQIDNSAGTMRIFRPGALYHNLSSTLSDWNTAGRDLDTKIQGDTDANLLFVDASTDRVGIGTATPAAKLDVVGTAQISGQVTHGNLAGTGTRVVGAGSTGILAPIAYGTTSGTVSEGNHGHTVTESWSIPVGDGTNVIPTGVYTDWQAPFAGTLTAWRILPTKFTSGTTGSVVFDLWATTYAGGPPVVGNSISTSKPTLSSANKAEDTTITDWTEAFSAGTWFRLNVDSSATVTLATLILEYVRTI
jgi:hypothetical protein